jgi:hypothetical protein
MEVIQKLFKDTASKMAEHEKQAQGKRQAKTNMLKYTENSMSLKEILQQPSEDQDMNIYIGGKREREESVEGEEPPMKRGSSPALGEQDEEKTENEEPRDAHQGGKGDGNPDAMDEVEETL